MVGVTLTRRARRRIDWLVAAVIAIVALTAAGLLYLGSDVRATTLDATPTSKVPAVPAPPTTVPTELDPVWTLTTDPAYGSVVTPYGTVATASAHSVRGFSAQTGAPLWSYTRSNRTLCGIGSGDTTADALDAWTGVHGVMTVFAKNGYCSQVTLLDPATGERLFQRTSPNQDPARLFFGSPYVGWTGSDYLELWRHDLVATIRYGNQPNPVNSNGPHLGCTFSDAAVTADQLATIEHCGGSTNLVLNWPTPSDAPTKGDQGWDANHSTPKATIPLGSGPAVILSVTADRAAVLVAEPTPTIAIYDSAGKRVSHTAVDVPTAAIAATAKAGLTPTTTIDGSTYTLVGTHLIALSTESLTVPAPPATPTGAAAGTAAEDVPSGDAGSVASADGNTSSTISVTSPVVDWTASGALGLPTRIGAFVLVATTAGIEVRDADGGHVTRTIPVDRGGYAGRVDLTAVGAVIVEQRGASVVGLAAPKAP